MAPGHETSTQPAVRSDLYFGPFRLEGTKHLWRGERLVEMRPRPLAVLRYLAGRPGQFISSEELLKRLWPGIYVTKTVLRVCVHEIRQALEEDPTTPQFVETVGRQGYRFIAPLATTPPPVTNYQLAVGSSDTAETKPPQLGPENWQLPTPFVGRRQELARLHEMFERVRRGERQIMFLLGESGIGKTTLVDRFLDQVGTSEPVRIGQGQCVEQYGSGEAYLPLLEALGQLCREPGGEQVLAVLHRYAPTWLAQMPGLLKAGELEAVQRQGQGINRERMLRELAEAIEAIAADAVLVLVLEDLQWSDPSTLDVLGYLAQRRRSVQLYILGTYRPADVVAGGHPLCQVVQELYGRRQCEELVLELLSEAEVEEYLQQRAGRRTAIAKLGQMIYRRTDGNALFMVSFVDYLLQHELLAEDEGQGQLRADLSAFRRLVPHSLQQMILQQIEHLSADEQQLLYVASVGGVTFTGAEVAGVVGGLLEEVEDICDRLASRERLIAVAGLAEWPDGAVTVRYQFRHALYQQVLYEQIGQAQRVRLHQQFGEWKEGRYGERTVEIASELAVHFTEGRDYHRAVQYRHYAAEQALRRSAYHEAEVHCVQGLKLLEAFPDTREHTQLELALLMTLGVALIVTKGYTAPEVEQTYLRARTLCEQEGKTSHLFSVLYGLWNCYTTRGELQTAYPLAEQLLDIAQRAQDSSFLLMAHWAMGRAQYWYGRLLSAREHLEQILTLYNPTEHGALVSRYSQDVQLTVPSFVAVALWLLGYPDQARGRIEQALAQESDLPSSFSLAHALTNAAVVHQFCGESLRTQERAETTITFATEHGFPHWVNWGTALRGWALAAQGQGEVGISLLRQSLTALAASGVQLARPYILTLLGDVYQRMEQAEDGLNTVAEAIAQVQDTGERYCEAELYRLKGDLLLAQESKRQKAKACPARSRRDKTQKAKIPDPRPLNPDPQEEAEACFLKAIEIARTQQAKSLELRATMSLARLWQRQGKRRHAHTTLSAIYGWFTEGFDTKDLQEAKALLDALRE